MSLNLPQLKNILQASGEVKFNPACNLEQLFCFELDALPEGIWTYISDSSRFNRELGFAPREQTEVDGKMLVKTTALGFKQEWIEEPWTWVAGKIISFERNYIKGMATYVHSLFYIVRDEARHKSCVYIYFGWQLPNPLWKTFVKTTESVIRSKFASNFVKIDDYLRRYKNDFSGRALVGKTPVLTESGLARLKKAGEELKKKNLNSDVIDRLTEHIKTADDIDLDALRVLQLARDWKQPDYRDVLAVALHSTRAGLLNISWNVICPHCRGARFEAQSLGDIPQSSECDTCEIDFKTDEPDIVEIVFKINPAVRAIPTVLYCAAEPAKKSHIKIQQHIEPGQKLRLKIPEKEAVYRARAIGIDTPVQIEIARGEDKMLIELFEPQQTAYKAGLGSDILLQNKTDKVMVFSLEEMQWQTLALRPSQVLAFPEFRDLFANEHLSSSVNLHLGEQTIMFTDIVGSTKFYDRVGDAKAFAEVRVHFQEVFEEVKNHGGVVVKTIGDAVMAAFPSAPEAFEASVKIQKRFFESRRDLSIRVRISIHTGTVIAVQLSSGLDYFGSVVNLGAKIQSCAEAGEIAMTTAVYDSLRLCAVPLTNYPVTQKIHTRDASVALPISVVLIKG